MEKEALARLLEKDELVLWSGKPAPFKVLDQYYKPVFFRNLIIICVVIAVLMAAVVFYGASGGKSINYTAVGVLLCSPFVVVISNLFSYRNYGKKCQYFVTNKNIIAYLSETQKRMLPLGSISTFESVPQSAGTWSIRIGKAVGIPDKKNREYALNFVYKDTSGETNRSCLLFNLSEKDNKRVLELIEKYRVVA